MTRQISFTKYEKKVFPSFRQKISKAESIEDVKKIYDQAAVSLLADVFAGQIDIESEDMILAPETDRSFRVSGRLKSSEVFNEVWEKSDLPQMISRLSDTAINRLRHLEKNLKKTEAKIRN